MKTKVMKRKRIPETKDQLAHVDALCQHYSWMPIPRLQQVIKEWNVDAKGTDKAILCDQLYRFLKTDKTMPTTESVYRAMFGPLLRHPNLFTKVRDHQGLPAPWNRVTAAEVEKNFVDWFGFPLLNEKDVKQCGLLYPKDHKCDPRVIDQFVGAGRWGMVYVPADPSCQCTECVIKKVGRLGSYEDVETMLALQKKQEKTILRITPRIHAVWYCPEEGFFYMMDKITGQNFSEWKQTVGKEALRKGLQALREKVALLHQLGYKHADLHEENVMFDEKGEPWLIDLDRSLERVLPKERVLMPEWDV